MGLGGFNMAQANVNNQAVISSIGMFAIADGIQLDQTFLLF